MEERIISVKEIVAKYKVSRQTIERAVKSGKIKKYRFAGGRKVFFYESDVVKLFS